MADRGRSRRRVLLVVTHLQGVGHLTRMAAVGRGLVRAGCDPLLVSGGPAVSTVDVQGIEFVQLPPVRIEGNDFSRLLDAEGRPVDENRRRERRALLERTIERFRPHVAVTELYPFGRRQLAAEFDHVLSLLATLEPRPAILSSVRDVLVPPTSPAKERHVEELLATRYDAVLVHGDPAFLPLDASWAVGPAAKSRLVYTGYVSDTEPAPDAARRRPASEILVSAGGSATGRPLFEAAVAAAQLWPEGPPWRILLGSRLPPDERSELTAWRSERIRIEDARRDFAALLARCAVSVSRGGYNTVVETLAAGTPAVIVPFEGGRETEQRQRADALAAHGIIALLPERDMTAGSLLAAVRTALTRPPPNPFSIALDGAARTAEIIGAFASGGRPTGILVG